MRAKLNELATVRGYKIIHTSPNTLAQNGHRERAGQTIVKRGRTTGIEANLPTNL
jgi:hypothetical protein